MVNLLGISILSRVDVSPELREDYIDRLKRYKVNLSSITEIIYSKSKFGINKEQIAEGIAIYYVGVHNKLFFLIKAYILSSKIILQNKINIISSGDPYLSAILSYLLSKRFAIPFNIQLHLDQIDSKIWIKCNLKNMLYNIISKYLLKKANSIRVVSQTLKDKLILLGINEFKIWVNPLYINIDKFENKSGIKIKNKHHFAASDNILLCVSRYSKSKNLDMLIRSFSLIVKKINNVVLLLVGNGLEKENLILLCKQLNIEDKVLFTDVVHYDEIPEYYAVCDIFVFSSVSEGRGMVLIEAALSRKPIISNYFDAVEELVIDGKTGFIIKNNNEKKMAEKIILLLKDQKKASEFGENGYKYIRNQLLSLNKTEIYTDMLSQTVNKYKRL